MASTTTVVHVDDEVSASGWVLLPNVAYQGRPVFYNAKLRQVAQEVDCCYLLAVSPEFEASLLLLIESGQLEADTPGEPAAVLAINTEVIERHATARGLLAELQDWCLETVGFVPRQFRKQWSHRIAKVLGDEGGAR